MGVIDRVQKAVDLVTFMPSARFAYRYRWRVLAWLFGDHVYLQEALSRIWPKAVRRELVINERIAEVPFAIRAMRLPIGSRVLDVGSRWSILPLELVSLGYQTVATDLDPFPIQGSGLDYVLADMRKPPFRAESFDGISVVSTLEHVGIGYYDARRETEDDLVMVRAMRGLLRPGGVLVVTVPFGKPGVGNLQRAYDSTRLERVMDGWIRDEVLFYTKHGSVWTQASEAEAAQEESVHGTQAVAMLRLRRQ